MKTRCHHWIFLNTRNIRETIDSFAHGLVISSSGMCLFYWQKCGPRQNLFLRLDIFSTLEDHIILTYLRKSFIPYKKGHWDFRFYGFGYFYFGVSVFVPKNFGFSVLVFIAVCGFSVFKHLVSVFAKILTGFGFDIRCGFRSFLFDLFGIWFLFDLSQQLRASTNL